MSWTVTCRGCGRRSVGAWSRCTTCGGVQVPDEPPWPPDDPGGEGLWRYRAYLPPVSTEVSLGEGGTPLLTCDRLAGLPRVWVKNETVNPTLSFKDRATALGVSLALDAGARGVVAASTGNTASSAAAYAARAGLPCRVVAATDGPKLAAARAAGARVDLVDGDFSTAYATAAASEADGWYPLTTTFRNPYLAEAHRSIAYEIVEQLGGIVPDRVLVPVGAGPLLVGLHHGFRALVAAGRAIHVPRLVAVQAAACAPLAAAWAAGVDTVSAAPPAETVAEAIADPLRGYEDEAALTLVAVRESAGDVVAVDDAAISAAAAELATGEGLLLEPAAAAPLAALRALDVGEDEVVVLLATGHAAKDGGAR